MSTLNELFKLNKDKLIDGSKLKSYDLKLKDWVITKIEEANLGQDRLISDKPTPSTVAKRTITDTLQAVDGVADSDLVTIKQHKALSSIVSSSYSWMNRSERTKSITIDGDKDTYYPVAIKISGDKRLPTRISIWKDLGSTTPDISGNHSNGTSSMWITYEGRSTTWDGNGGYLRIDHYSMPYANLCANAILSTKNSGSLVIYLRGGTCQYNISSTNDFSVNVYYARSDIENSNEYPTYVEPTTELGNLGILNHNYTYRGNLNGNATSASKVNNKLSITLGSNGSATIYNGSESKSISVTPSSIGASPKSHASTSNEYGLGTLNNYGHVKLQVGDLNGTSNTGGVAAGLGHTHSQYLLKSDEVKNYTYYFYFSNRGFGGDPGYTISGYASSSHLIENFSYSDSYNRAEGYWDTGDNYYYNDGTIARKVQDFLYKVGKSNIPCNGSLMDSSWSFVPGMSSYNQDALVRTVSTYYSGSSNYYYINLSCEYVDSNGYMSIVTSNVGIASTSIGGSNGWDSYGFTFKVVRV